MSSPDAGWYLDDADPALETYWDGERWTGHRRKVAQPATEVESARAGDIRVPVGTRADISPTSELIELQGDMVVSTEPFVATPPPTGLVPMDCVWSVVAYPGPPPAGPFKDAKVALQTVRVLQARTFDELVRAAGPPSVRTAGADGRFVGVWQKVGLFSGIWSVGLLFDRYGVCMGISSEVGT